MNQSDLAPGLPGPAVIFPALPLTTAATDRWYAATTLPQREALAVANLTAQGFRTFCPLELTLRRHARKTTQVCAPVFRGYVFIGMDPSRARWRSINGTFGIKGLISAGDQPLAVRPGVVETLIASTDGNGVLCYTDPLRPGAAVRLKTGPFAEQLGIIERLDGDNRVHLLMSLMGRRIRTAVDRDHLESMVDD